MAAVLAPFHDGARQFQERENILKKKLLRKFIVEKRITSPKMENENTRQSWEWEIDFEQSLWIDIGEEEGVTTKMTKPLVKRKAK